MRQRSWRSFDHQFTCPFYPAFCVSQISRLVERRSGLLLWGLRGHLWSGCWSSFGAVREHRESGRGLASNWFTQSFCHTTTALLHLTFSTLEADAPALTESILSLAFRGAPYTILRESKLTLHSLTRPFKCRRKACTWFIYDGRPLTDLESYFRKVFRLRRTAPFVCALLHARTCGTLNWNDQRRPGITFFRCRGALRWLTETLQRPALYGDGTGVLIPCGT